MKRILAIEGGGLRCMFAIEILAQLEARLVEQSGNTKLRLAHHFDLIAGTSGGALIASAVAMAKPMDAIRDFVIANANRMFHPARWYRRLYGQFDRSELADQLKEWLGEDTTLGSPDLRTNVMMVMRNVSTDAAWVVSNNCGSPYNDPARDDCNLKLPLWQLARASAAAPVYYPAEQIRIGIAKPRDYLFLDGGLTTYNNPSFLAFLYATTSRYGLSWPAGEDNISLLSIGSGMLRFENPNLKLDNLHYGYHLTRSAMSLLNATARSQDLLCRSFGRGRIATPLDSLIGDLDGVTTAVEPRLFRYYRLNPVLTKEGIAAIGCADINLRAVRQFDAVKEIESYCRVGKGVADRMLAVYCNDMVG